MLWRRHKCFVKKKHFTAYTNDDDRLANAPNSIPEAHFKDLIEYWNLNEIQEQSRRKKESGMNQIDRHTMGPKSFARKEYELLQMDEENKSPSQALMYKETRKRKEGKNYKTSYDLIQSNIDKMEEVQRDSKVDGDSAFHEVMNPENLNKKSQLRMCLAKKQKSNKATVGGVIVPEEFLQPYKEEIVKDNVAQLLTLFKQHLPPESFNQVITHMPGHQVQEGRLETNDHISDDEAACEQEAHIDHNEKEQ